MAVDAGVLAWYPQCYVFVHGSVLYRVFMMISSKLPLDKQALAVLLPHCGNMVLLDSVERASESDILCRANSHWSAQNPLRVDDGRLSVFAGVEYAAQAMALHNALCAASVSDKGVREGVVAVASKLVPHVDRLDALKGWLNIKVSCLDGTGDSSLYEFDIYCDERPVLNGRLLVMLV